MDNYLL